MSSFLLALQFLSIIPVRVKDAAGKRMAQAVIYFPLVGLLLGLILAGANILLSAFYLEQWIINTILVVLLIILTGGLHQDGLADTMDAFASGKGKDEMLMIMRDSRIGAMGVLSMICTILLKIALLSAIAANLKNTSLLLMCVLSRWSVVPAMFFFPYARQEGKAGVFIRGMNLKMFILSTFLAIICASLLWHIKGLIAFLIVSVCAYIVGKFVSKKIGGITGDTLGATIELTEIVTLLTVCSAQGLSIWIS